MYNLIHSTLYKTRKSKTVRVLFFLDLFNNLSVVENTKDELRGDTSWILVHFTKFSENLDSHYVGYMV